MDLKTKKLVGIVSYGVDDEICAIEGAPSNNYNSDQHNFQSDFSSFV